MKAGEAAKAGMSFWTQAKNKACSHARNVALSHSLFALPFAYIALMLAAEGKPSAAAVFWVTLAMVAARSAALALNNLIDLRYDKKQPRFRRRPLVTGEIGKAECLLFIVLCLGVFFGSAAKLHPVCIRLSPVALFFFVVYPYMKRFSWTCHLVLGLTLALAPLAAWIAVKGAVDAAIAILAVAVGVWIAGFDIVYGCLDVDFDKANGLHSIPERFGVPAALLVSRLFHLASVAGFIVAGHLFALGLLYYGGIILTALVLYYQHRIVRAGDLSRVTQAYFLRNGLVGLSLFLFTFLSVVHGWA